jgi:hypothetical protein
MYSRFSLSDNILVSLRACNMKLLVVVRRCQRISTRTVTSILLPRAFQNSVNPAAYLRRHLRTFQHYYASLAHAETDVASLIVERVLKCCRTLAQVIEYFPSEETWLDGGAGTCGFMEAMLSIGRKV